MMGFIKAGLLRVLGSKNYLAFISKIFFVSYKNGWLKSNPAYYTHYRVMQFIQPGCVVLDIGANLGYYSVLFAQKVGKGGKVYSVEPIPLYVEVLKQNISKYTNVEVLPYALGLEDGVLRMGNPSPERYRHGLMHVLKEGEKAKVVYEVPVKNPEKLFGNFPRIDYIKCDIEGYEVPVIPAMKSLIQKHRPIVQVETDGENKMILKNLFEQLDYMTVYASKNGFEPYRHGGDPLPGDMVAIPKEKWKQ